MNEQQIITCDKMIMEILQSVWSYMVYGIRYIKYYTIKY